MFVKWEDMTALEQLQCEYSDLFKDVYGMRPHHVSNIDMADEAFLRKQIETLVTYLDD